MPQRKKILYWHGLAIDSLNDGAMEEGSPDDAAERAHRYSFTPSFGDSLVSHPCNFERQSCLGPIRDSLVFFFFLLIGPGPAGGTTIRRSTSRSIAEPSFVPMVETMRERLLEKAGKRSGCVRNLRPVIAFWRLSAAGAILGKSCFNASATEGAVLLFRTHLQYCMDGIQSDRVGRGYLAGSCRACRRNRRWTLPEYGY